MTDQPTSVAITLNHMAAQWCVYEVRRPPHDTTPIYIGLTHAPPFMSITDALDNEEFGKLVETNTMLHIIIRFVGTNEDAKSFRQNAVANLRPPCNMVVARPNAKYKWIRCDQTGEVFPNSAAVCRKFGFHASNFSAYLNGSAGKMIGGYTFARVPAPAIIGGQPYAPKP